MASEQHTENGADTPEKHGEWTVIEYIGKSYCLARCSCDRIAKRRLSQLRDGTSTRCIECRNKAPRDYLVTHGKTDCPEYGCWLAMRRRCYDETFTEYHRYGARGIIVCDRWRNDFAAFLTDMGPRPSPKHSLDRFPNGAGNYEPGNVRWATPAEQVRNTSQNVMIAFRGETLCQKDMAARYGIKYHTLRARLKAGMDPEAALLSGPLKKGPKPKQ